MKNLSNERVEMLAPRTGRILLVDDDNALLELLRMDLQSLGHQVDAFDAPAEALQAVRSKPVDVVVTDLRMEPIDGMGVMRAVQAIDPDLPVIIMTAHGSIPHAVEAMRSGAQYYLTKPFSNEELQRLVDEGLEYRVSVEQVNALHRGIDTNRYRGVIFKSPVMASTVEQLRRFARSDASVFLTGESGTGKEVAACTLHEASPRADRPFLAINCGAIPESLLESELFGHVKGAFTGATSHHEGLFTRANGGTVLLDEVGDLPLPLQVKLLRVLQERRIRSVGSGTEMPIDVRVIAATHRNIDAMVQEGSFREDLYYRLHVIPIEIPPLRERREDIPLLAQHFLELASERTGTKTRGFRPCAIEKLLTRPWPGNVRELQNVVEYAVAAADQKWINANCIPEPLRSATNGSGMETLSVAKTRFERGYLLHLMRATSGNVAQAARIAGRHRPDVYKLLRKYDIEPGDYKSDAIKCSV